MSDNTLTWNKPMTSEQAQRYHLTKGFVPEELYDADLRAAAAERDELKREVSELKAANQFLCALTPDQAEDYLRDIVDARFKIMELKRTVAAQAAQLKQARETSMSLVNSLDAWMDDESSDSDFSPTYIALNELRAWLAANAPARESPELCKCGNTGQQPRVCPYAEDVNNNSEYMCNCCPSCTRECAMDI